MDRVDRTLREHLGSSVSRPRSLVVALLAALALLLVLLAPPTALAETVVPIVFPLQEKIQWEDTWGADRSGGERTHRGNDLPAPKMTPVVAVKDGRVDWMNMEAEPTTYNGVPSFNLMLRGDDGNDYFYLHLNNDTPGTDDGQGGIKNAYAAGLSNGSTVKQGQVIGYVGDSGNAEETISHLHFELHLGGYQGKGETAINPYASLMAAGPPPLLAADGSTSFGEDPAPTEEGESSGEGIPSKIPPVFSDVTSSDWFFDDLLWLAERKIVEGRSDGSFDPYAGVTRAQFAALVVRALEAGELLTLPESQPDPELQAEADPAVPVATLEGAVAGTSQRFVDVSATYWAEQEIEVAAALGVVRGVGDGSLFAPEASITRAQMAAMVSRALGIVEADADELSPALPTPFIDLTPEYWAAAEISRVARLEIIRGRGDGTFGPEEPSQRVHTAVVIARALRTIEALEGNSP